MYFLSLTLPRPKVKVGVDPAVVAILSKDISHRRIPIGSKDADIRWVLAHSLQQQVCVLHTVAGVLVLESAIEEHNAFSTPMSRVANVLVYCIFIRSFIHSFENTHAHQGLVPDLPVGTDPMNRQM